MVLLYRKNNVESTINIMKIIAVIPAFNEGKVIAKVINQLKNYINIDNIIVINDGSKDNTVEQARKEGAKVYTHYINRGLGGALGTGMEAALLNGADIAVTLDADNQHNPAEIKKLIAPIINNQADVVIGSRFLNSQKMPFIRKIYNWTANFCTWLIFGVWTTDSQSGFRAFSKTAMQKIEIKTNKMEVSSEIIKEIKGHKLRIKEVPIEAIYTEYSMSKGQNFIEGLKTVMRLILLRFRK